MILYALGVTVGAGLVDSKVASLDGNPALWICTTSCVIAPAASILLKQQTPNPEAQFPDAVATISPEFEHSSEVTQIPVVAGIDVLVHTLFGNVTTLKRLKALLSRAGKAVVTDTTHKRQSVHFIL